MAGHLHASPSFLSAIFILHLRQWHSRLPSYLPLNDSLGGEIDAQSLSLLQEFGLSFIQLWHNDFDCACWQAMANHVVCFKLELYIHTLSLWDEVISFLSCNLRSWWKVKQILMAFSHFCPVFYRVYLSSISLPCITYHNIRAANILSLIMGSIDGLD